MAISDDDRQFLGRCVALAQSALQRGDQPFGSILVDGTGRPRYEDHNRVGDGDATRHPEFAIARWAVRHMTSDERSAATVYTSGEHCPMCAAAHAWVGLGRIVYACSSAQLAQWLSEWGAPAMPVAPLPITVVAPSAVVDGPAPEYAETMRALYRSTFAP